MNSHILLFIYAAIVIEIKWAINRHHEIKLNKLPLRTNDYHSDVEILKKRMWYRLKKTLLVAFLIIVSLFFARMLFTGWWLLWYILYLVINSFFISFIHNDKTA